MGVAVMQCCDTMISVSGLLVTNKESLGDSVAEVHLPLFLLMLSRIQFKH